MNNKNNTVQSLRKSGFEVKVTHYRYSADWLRPVLSVVGKSKQHGIHFIDQVAQEFGLEPKARQVLPNNQIFPRGGLTEVLVIKDGKTAVGAAHCSLADNYCRRQGIAMAVGRAVNDFNNGVYV